MPTYEYACRDCEEHLEVVQSFTDDPLETCGTCGGRLRKVFSAAGIIFKGSGYYVTDTRAEGKSSSASSGSSSSPSSGSGSGDDSSKSADSSSSAGSSSKSDSSGSGGSAASGGSAEAKTA